VKLDDNDYAQLYNSGRYLSERLLGLIFIDLTTDIRAYSQIHAARSVCVRTEESAKKSIKRKKIGTCHQGIVWEDSFPSLSVNARQKSSIKFATVDQVPGIIKCTTNHRV
jgi:hypothetical protein